MAGKKKLKILFVHFHPLEQYPPAMNLIDYLGSIPDINLSVITNKVVIRRRLSTFSSAQAGTKIYRPACDSDSGWVRYFNYVLFYAASFFILLWERPSAIIYMETLSAWPALLFKRWRGKSLKLLAHYHEYSTPEEYETRMFLSKWMHRMELKHYQQFSWLSQTNAIRLQKFVADAGLEHINPVLLHTLPNYPPKSWLKRKDKPFQHPVKLVYVGSLGYQNMYLKEVADWIGKRTDKYSLDIYAHNLNPEAMVFLEERKTSNVHYRGGCDYQSLPEILSRYDVGLVIYKPFSENTIHAVSNKVFEYLALGLDVWFSADMTYTMNYVKTTSYPKIVPVDFREMEHFDDDAALNREGLNYEAGKYFCEPIYKQLADVLLSTETIN